MTVAGMGAAAIGAVVGWWCTPLITARFRARTWGAAAAAVVVLWLESVWFGGRAAGLALAVGSLAGLAAHAAFRAVLVARFAHDRS